MTEVSSRARELLRIELAVRTIDAQLERRAATVLRTLNPNHEARLSNWRFPLCHTPQSQSAWVRYHPEEFAALSVVARHAELVRAEAEAWLVHEELGYVLLSDTEREELFMRALGIMPADEANRFAEIVLLHDVSPQHILVAPEHFLSSIKLLAEVYGTGTALGYGLILAAGVRSKSDIIKYGEQVQLLFDRVTLTESVVPILHRILHGAHAGTNNAPFSERFALLTQVHEELAEVRPNRLGREFRLNRILEAELRDAKSDGRTPGTELAGVLGLVSLDAVMLSKLLFPLRLVCVVGDSGAPSHLFLEVQFEEKSVYWESTTAAPLSHVPVQSGTKLPIFDLFARTYQEIGIWNSRHGQLTRAIAAFKQALALNKELPEALGELSQVYLRANQPNEAIATAQAAVALLPQWAEAYVTLGSGYLVREMPDKAIEAFKTAIRLQPNLAEAHNDLGYALGQKNETQAAIAEFEIAVRLRPDYVQALFNLGNAQLNAGKVDEAIDAYRRATRINPGFVRAWYNLGQAYYRQKLLDEAMDAYRRVLRVSPRHAGALYNLGIIYRDKGMKDKAVEAIEQAVSLNPNLLR